MEERGGTSTVETEIMVEAEATTKTEEAIGEAIEEVTEEVKEKRGADTTEVATTEVTTIEAATIEVATIEAAGTRDAAHHPTTAIALSKQTQRSPRRIWTTD